MNVVMVDVQRELPAVGAHEDLLIRSDGAAQPNPGHGAAAAVLYSVSGARVGHVSAYLGPNVSGNQAELAAAVLALRTAHHLGVRTVYLEVDNALVVEHAQGDARVDSLRLRPMVQELRRWRDEIGRDRVGVTWVQRDTVADAHDLTQAQLQGRPELEERLRGSQRLVLEMLDQAPEGALSADQPHLDARGRAHFVLPFYTVVAGGMVVPSIEAAAWDTLTDLARACPTSVVWRPYGARHEPLPWSRVWAGRAFPDVPAVAPFDRLRLGPPSGHRGYRGTPIHLLAGGPWDPMTGEYFA